MDFYKFPRTKHLPWSNIVDRDDLILSENEANAIMASPRLLISEKVDGANVGVSVVDGKVRVQNRGNFISNHPQFDSLKAWVAERESMLAEVLGKDLILFGEWLYARHTVTYRNLPDYFLAFDLFDKETQSFNQDDLAVACDILGISMPVSLVTSGPIDREGIDSLLTRQSAYGDTELEGVYLKALDASGKVLSRCKLVRSGFARDIENNGRWDAKGIVRNNLAR